MLSSIYFKNLFIVPSGTARNLSAAFDSELEFIAKVNQAFHPSGIDKLTEISIRQVTALEDCEGDTCLVCCGESAQWARSAYY